MQNNLTLLRNSVKIRNVGYVYVWQSPSGRFSPLYTDQYTPPDVVCFSLGTGARRVVIENRSFKKLKYNSRASALDRVFRAFDGSVTNTRTDSTRRRARWTRWTSRVSYGRSSGIFDTKNEKKKMEPIFGWPFSAAESSLRRAVVTDPPNVCRAAFARRVSGTQWPGPGGATTASAGHKRSSVLTVRIDPGSGGPTLLIGRDFPRADDALTLTAHAWSSFLSRESRRPKRTDTLAERTARVAVHFSPKGLITLRNAGVVNVHSIYARKHGCAGR